MTLRTVLTALILALPILALSAVSAVAGANWQRGHYPATHTVVTRTVRIDWHSNPCADVGMNTVRYNADGSYTCITTHR